MIRSSPNPSLVAYSTKGKVPAFTVPASKQAYLFNARCQNNSGSTINVGILQKLNQAKTGLWQYTAVGPVYTNVSSTLYGGSSVNIFSGTNNDGFIVQADLKFGMIGLTLSSHGSGGTYTYKYWNGSAFTTLTTLEVPANYNSDTDMWIVFQPPDDTAFPKGGPTGLDQSKYSIFVQSTTAPGASVGISALWIGVFLDLYQGVANNAVVQMSYPDSKPYLLNGGEGVIPYFSTANAANQIAAYYAFND